MRLLLLLLFVTPTLQKLLAKCGSTNKIYKDSTFHISTHQLPEPLPTPAPAPALWEMNKKGWEWEPISKEQQEEEDDPTITPLQQDSENHAHIPFQDWSVGKLPPLYSILFLKDQSQEKESYPEERKHPDLFDLFTKGSQQRIFRKKRELGEKRHCTIRFEASSTCSRLVHHITLGDTVKMSCANEYLNLVDNSRSNSYCGLKRLPRTKAYDKSLEITYVGRGETLLEGYVTCGQ